MAAALLCLGAVLQAAAAADHSPRHPAVDADQSQPSSADIDSRQARRLRRSSTVADCPSSCVCRTAAALDCTLASQSDYCTLTSSLPVDVTDLRLRLPADDDVTSSELYCDSSSSSSMTSSSIRLLARLERLDLSANRIADPYWFRYSSLFARLTSSSTSSLVAVSVADNRLERLVNGTFDAVGFDAVETLDASDNAIRQLDAGCFSGLGRLRTLVLAGNAIDRLDPDVFNRLTSLTTLNLDRNRLSSIDLDGLLSTLGRLGVLTLAGNAIRRLGVYVDVETSPTSRLPVEHDYHPRRRRLNRLDLSDNELESWPFQTSSAPISAAIAGDDDDDRTTSGFDVGVLVLDGNPIRSLMSASTPNDDGVSRNNRKSRRRDVNVNAVDELSVSRMPELVAVDVSAFGGLMTSPEMLAVLSMHDNRRLRYVDRREADELRSLRHLYIHNNNLTTGDGDCDLTTIITLLDQFCQLCRSIIMSTYGSMLCVKRSPCVRIKANVV